MSTPEREAAHRFRECLTNMAEFAQPPEPSAASEMSQRFRDALMMFGSESDDNKHCAEHLEYGIIRGNGRTSFGLRLCDAPYSITSVLWNAEGCPIPTQLADALPELSQNQWDACIRLATLVLTAFESTVNRAPD